VPVRKPNAIAFYLGGYLSKSLPHKPADAKRTRPVNYSHGCPRVFRGRFSWSNEFGWLWRAKLRKWAAKHGCGTFKEVAALFGPKWAYHHRAAILATKLNWYPTSEHSAGDGHKFPSGSVNIRIGTWVNGEISYAEAIAEGAPAEMSNSCTGLAENPEKAAGLGSDLEAASKVGGAKTTETSEIGQHRQYVLKRRVDSVAVGLSWSKRALANAPSLMEELYPELARRQREKEKPQPRRFECEEVPFVDAPF
jgi:hypothetical protein